MSIFKDTFKEGVKEQLNKRQEAVSSRTPDAIQYFNARNSWIRMTSSVNVDGKNTSAKRYVLHGGVRNNTAANVFELKSGVGTFANKAYSTATPEGQSHKLGMRPMPGITSIDVKSKSAYGSLREVVVNFQCWDIRQLEELELLYMRPGYSVLVEWGWAPYLGNDGKLKNDVSPYNDVLYGGKSKETVWKELFEKASDIKKSPMAGNYDAHYGIIKNYSWSARPDGGYDCTSTIISIGEILESLKINYVPADSPIAKKGVFGTAEIFGQIDYLSGYFGLNPLWMFENDGGNVRKSYSQNIIAGICNELYRLLKDELDEFEERSFTSNKWTFYRFDLDVSNAPLNEDSDFNDKEQIYILLKDFVDILNKYVVLKDSQGKSPLIKISVNEGAHMGGEDKPLLCLGHPLQISTNPTVCLIKNDAWLNPSSLGFEEGWSSDFDTLTKKIESLKTNYWYNNDYTNQQLGVIGNIYVNLGYIYSLVTDPNLEAQDKKEKNDIILFDFLKSMMAGISTSIGNVATFDIFSDPIDSTARIIDVNYTDPNPRNNTYENAFTFQLQNTKSVVRSYKFESQIFPDQTTTIAIGAQAQGGALGTDTNTLIDFNQNLTDRIIPKKDAPYNSGTDPKQELEEKVKNLKENTNIIIEYIDEIDPTLFGTGDYDVNNASKYNNALKDLINFFKSLVQNDNRNRAIIPTKLSIETDGIGGIVIGNLFKIPNDFLPRGYKGDGAGPEKIAYAVTGLAHSLQNNDWKTTIDAQFILLDDPKKGMSLTNVKDIKTVVDAAAKEPIKKAVEIIEKVTNDIKTSASSSKPRKTAKCSKSITIITQANAPEVKISGVTPWTAVKTSYPIVNGPINVAAVGTPYDSGNAFAYKMSSTKVYNRPNRKIDHIVLHHTAGGHQSDPTLPYKTTWEKKDSSADFVVEGNGRIAGFKNFRNLTSWHYGKDCTWGPCINNSSIGIEIQSFGQVEYCQSSNKFINYYGGEMQANELCFTKPYREHNLWHALTTVQVSAVANLLIALYNSGALHDKTKFIQGVKSTGRYDILFPEKGLKQIPPPGIITHGTGRQGKVDVFPQKNLLDMLDDLPNLISSNSKTSINWVTSV